MILDQKYRFDYLLTYNTGDFMDACERGRVRLINEAAAADSYGL